MEPINLLWGFQVSADAQQGRDVGATSRIKRVGKKKRRLAQLSILHAKVKWH